MTEAVTTQTATTAAPTTAPVATPPQPTGDASTTPATPPAAPEPKPIDYASKFNVIAQRERQLEKDRSAFKTEREQYQQELTGYQQLRKTAADNPLAVLEHFGVTYEQLTNYILQDPANAANNEVKKELENLKKSLEEDKKKQKDAQTEQQIAAYKSGIKSFTAGKPEFEFFNDAGDEAIALAFELALYSWQQTGQEPDRDAICAQVEQDLAKEYEARFERMTKLSRFKSKLGTPAVPPSDPSASGAPVSKEPTVSQVTTLTNSMTPRTEATPPPTDDPNERMRRAIAAMGRK